MRFCSVPRASRLARMAFAVGALAALAGCRGDEAGDQKSIKQVRTIALALSDYQPEVSLTGDIEAQVQSDISFRVSGRIVERFVDVGDHVTPDQVLARVDGQEQRIGLDTANAALASAQAQLQQSEAAFGRQKTLITSNATSQSSLDAAQENLSVAQAAVASAT